MNLLNSFLAGTVVLSFLVCALFFLRYWSRTRDELFLSFSIAFGLLAAGQTILALTNIPTEERGSLYLIRLAAFLLMLLAIYRKNAIEVPRHRLISGVQLGSGYSANVRDQSEGHGDGRVVDLLTRLHGDRRD